MRVKECGEFGFIDSIKEDTIVDPSTVTVGIGDDCAVYSAEPNREQLITTDMMVAGIHFSPKTTKPFDVGYRLGAANISDIAAMGGTPRQAVIAVALPDDMTVEYMHRLFDGLKSVCHKYGVNLIGGDTVKTDGSLVLSVTVIGDVPTGKALLRSGAKPGDLVAVTGPVGSSAVGLGALLAGVDGYEVAKAIHKRPEPQVAWGLRLRHAGAHSANDISDGLASELNEIAKASGVVITIQAENIPLLDETRQWAKETNKDPLSFAYFGGEDFQLVTTVPAKAFQRGDLTGLHVIGHVTAGDEPVVYVETGEGFKTKLPAKGYNHFTEDKATDGKATALKTATTATASTATKQKEDSHE